MTSKRRSRLHIGEPVIVRSQNALVTGRVQSFGKDSTGAWVSVETIEGTVVVPLDHVQRALEEREKT
jgi:hypothetical protein